MLYNPLFSSDSIESQTIARSFSEIANEILANFSTRDDLLDTALTIITLVRKVSVHTVKIKTLCSKMLQIGDVNKRYLEIFGLIDMEDLLKLLQNGKIKIVLKHQSFRFGADGTVAFSDQKKFSKTFCPIDRISKNYGCH